MNDVMIDIETLSTKNNALIVTIGAIKFNRKDKIKPLDEFDKFYVRINQNSCIKLGMDIDPNTVEWWKKQSKEARYEVFENKDRIDIKDALIQLYDFIKDVKYVWANSPNFDCVILENAFNICEIEIPWKFWNLRDCRTAYDLGNTNLKNFTNTISHNALIDCYNQILCLKNSLENIKK